MSVINEYKTASDDDSYRNLSNNRIEDDASVIDDSQMLISFESETTTNTEDADSEDTDSVEETDLPASKLRSKRESSILPIRRKPVRLIESDDDDDNDLIPISISIPQSLDNASTRLIGESSVDKQQHPIDSSEEESYETRAQSSNPTKEIDETPQIEEDHPDNDDMNLSAEIRNKRITQQFGYNAEGILNSTAINPEEQNKIWRPSNIYSAIVKEIEDVSSRPRDHDSGIIETQLLTVNVTNSDNDPTKEIYETQQIEEDHPDDGDMNLSAGIRDKTLTQQFRYKAEGIVNSTAKNSGEQNKIWRPNNSYTAVGEDIEDVSSNLSVEALSDHDSDIIEISSGEETYQTPKKTPFKLPKLTASRQQTLHSFMVKAETITPRQKISPLRFPQRKPLAEQQPRNQPVIQSPKVSHPDYQSQLRKVENLETDYIRLQSLIESMNLNELPDQGMLVKERLKTAKNRYMQEKHELERMAVSVTIVNELIELDDIPQVDEIPQGAPTNVAWKDIEAGANAVLPKTFGKQAMSTYNAQKAVTLDRLQQLHEALQTCPKDDDFEEDPKGIKVSLMPHQKRALAWVLFREKEKPSGGILADDMGLGKTLTMLSLVVKSLQLERSGDSDEENEYIGKHTKYNGGSLVVCPASLINQWSGEIDKRLKRGLISYYLYHGTNRETRAKHLAKYDVVITTYAIINIESERMGAAFKIKWRRVILDEAHTIRNHKTHTSVACCQLSARSRWALTGTPMHNKELDMYALLKFLKCSPFDDLVVWKRWVGDKSSGGLERLHTVISSLMLRRTKAELMEKGALNCMPEKKWELINVELDENEMRVYHKVMIFSQTLFAQFLHQRAEKRQDHIDQKFTEVSAHAPNEEYFKMRKKLMKLNKVKDVSQHEILVLLLRLRQICCHPSLISAMLDASGDEIGEEDEKSDHLNLLEQLEKLNLEDEDECQPRQSLGAVAQGLSQNDKITLKQASRGHLHPSDPVFATDRLSSKIKAMLKVLRHKVLAKGDKAIIVSQWSSYLKLVAVHLTRYDIEFDQLDGQVPVDKRMAMVDRINNRKDKLQVLLLSLTAGGVGLNLVGANHLFLLDLHWNPQLENQAQDRIYRVGQTKPVFVYKFMATGTIEERIKALQDKKLAIAEGLLTGTKQVIQNKLSLEDLRMIFGM